MFRRFGVFTSLVVITTLGCGHGLSFKGQSETESARTGSADAAPPATDAASTAASAPSAPTSSNAIPSPGTQPAANTPEAATPPAGPQLVSAVMLTVDGKADTADVGGFKLVAVEWSAKNAVSCTFDKPLLDENFHEVGGAPAGKSQVAFPLGMTTLKLTCKNTLGNLAATVIVRGKIIQGKPMINLLGKALADALTTELVDGADPYKFVGLAANATTVDVDIRFRAGETGSCVISATEAKVTAVNELAVDPVNQYTLPGAGLFTATFDRALVGFTTPANGIVSGELVITVCGTLIRFLVENPVDNKN